MEHEGHPDLLTMELMAAVGNELVISVDTPPPPPPPPPHPVVAIIKHLWNFDHPCKTVTQNSVEVCFVDCINSRLLPDTGNILIWCVHCCDHCDNIVVHPLLDLEVVLIIHPIQGVEALVEDIFVFFWWPTLPGSCSTTDGNIRCHAAERTLDKVKRLSIVATYCLDSFRGSLSSNNKTEAILTRSQ